MAEHILVMRPIGLWFFRPDRPLKPWLAVARLHGLDPDKTVYAKQNPGAVDAGVFHNDVISVGNKNILLCHAEAFCDFDSVATELKNKFAQHCGGDLVLIEVRREQISLTEAVESGLRTLSTLNYWKKVATPSTR